MSNWGSRFQV